MGNGKGRGGVTAILVLIALWQLALCHLVLGGHAAAQTTHKPVRIALAHFSHEATTFSPAMAGVDGFSPTTLEGDALLHFGNAIRGFVKVASEHSDVDLVPLRSFGSVIGGSSVGYITREAFDLYADRIVEDLKAAMPVDAVFLSLHGAAAVEGIARPEADLARRVRDVVGPDVAIAGTFDPHGNEDAAFLQQADFAFCMKYYPHYDGRLQGARAARALIRAARGDYVATTATRKPGIITPTVLQWTGAEPWMGIVQRALIWEAREPDVFVNVFAGFPWNDSVEAGAAIQVMTNNDQALADRIADDMTAYMLRRRRELFTVPIIAPGKAVAQAVDATAAGAVPIVLADYSDRGGDATHILKEIIAQDLGGVLIATLRDERTIDALLAEGAKAGDVFDRRVGGFAIMPASGEPVRVKGQLMGLGARQVRGRAIKVALIAFGRGNLLVLTDRLVQITRPDQMASLPIDLDAYTTWVLKSRVHFRRGFDDTGFAKTIVIVDAPEPTLGTVYLDALDYKVIDLQSFFPYSEGGLDAARAGRP